ncbi:hypothetical protein BDW72DRAFT_83102 [Aspergillus terricola var. indicus]
MPISSATATSRSLFNLSISPTPSYDTIKALTHIYGVNTGDIFGSIMAESIRGQCAREDNNKISLQMNIAISRSTQRVCAHLSLLKALLPLCDCTIILNEVLHGQILALVPTACNPSTIASTASDDSPCLQRKSRPQPGIMPRLRHIAVLNCARSHRTGRPNYGMRPHNTQERKKPHLEAGRQLQNTESSPRAQRAPSYALSRLAR